MHLLNLLGGVNRNPQQGVALLFALVFVTAMTYLMVTMSSTSNLEERIASNEQNKQMAFQAAEAIVRFVESDTFDQAPLSPFNLDVFVDNCAEGYCRDQGSQRWVTHDFDDPDISRSFDNQNAQLQGLATQPSYFVELVNMEGGQVGGVCPKVTFRVVGRGQAADSAEYLVETLFRFRPATFADGSCG
jgi:hypothetical protein